MDILTAIRKRRSVRSFQKKTVSEQDIHLMLEAARLAPSGGNLQNWTFGVVTDKTQITRLARTAGNQDWISTAPLVFAMCTELRKDFRLLEEDDFELQVDKERFGADFIDYLRAFPDQEPVAMLFENSNPLLPGQQIFLTAISLGLHACFVGYLDVRKASAILELPKNHACLFLLPVGYAACEPRPIERKNISRISFRNKWGNSIT